MQSIQVKAKALGIHENIVFTGARSDVDRLYSVMDVFCLPSFYEGMPVVAWEAQANGLPCVFSDKISTEAKLEENCKFLSLDQSGEEWAKSLLSVKGRYFCTVPDLSKSVEDLFLIYRQRVGS